MRPTAPQRNSTSPWEAIAFTAVLLVFTLVLLVASFQLSGSSGLVPRIVAIPLALLLCYRLVRETVGLKRKAELETEAIGETRPDETGAILWLVALPAVSTVLGFIAGPAVYVIAWARFRAGERWITSVAAGAFTAAGILLLFTLLLGSHLPAGLLGYIRNG